MRATRKTQPYRGKGKGVLAGTRKPGAVLSAMLKGRTAMGGNPMDAQRRLAAGKVLSGHLGRKRRRRV